MVAPVDTYIYFTVPEVFEALRGPFEARSGSGGGRVLTGLLAEDDEIAVVVDSARAQVGREPLGIVTATEGDALEAIGAGADDAMALSSLDERQVTGFLARVRTRAAVRREGEQRVHDFAQSEKLAALGTLVAGVAHEVNNPLSTITLGYDVIREHLLADMEKVWTLRDQVRAGLEVSEDLQALLARIRTERNSMIGLASDIAAATESVTELVRDLRVFSRSDEGERSVVFHPRVVVDQALRLVKREFDSNTVLELDFDDELPELCLPKNRLAQVLTNLLLNAIQATREVEQDLHRIRVGMRVDDQYLALSISDSGPGISEEVQERIFDPFFTTKRPGQGTGLGLSISRSIIKHMGGDLGVSSVDGEGATFVCFLPLPTEQAFESSRRLRDPLPSTPPRLARGAVLLVDDDARVLRAIARILQDNYRVIVARDGREATELLVSGSHPDLVITELSLPEMDGAALFDWLEEHRPDLASKTLIMTGAQEKQRYRDFLEKSHLPVIHKPPKRDALLHAIERALSASDRPARSRSLGG